MSETLGLQDELLDKLVGAWRIERTFSTRQVENLAVGEWVLNHQFLRLHMRDVNEPPQYEAMVFIGFNPEKQDYIGHWLDTFGGEYSETLGIGKREGDAIKFEFRYPDSLLTNIFHCEGASWTSTIEQQNEAGEFVPFCTDRYTKK